ncbi:MAG: heparinase II/III family protein [Mediterraneibacter gnavus]
MPRSTSKKEELFEILESMEQQFLYLYQSYVPKYRQSNWGVLQTTSILQNAAWFGECFCLEEMKRIAEWAKDELLYQLESQIYGDGSHWEQSMMYHIEVLNSVTTMLVFRKRAGVETSKRIEEILYGMYDYVMHAAGPDHFQIAQGDSDVTDIRDVMTRGAMLFEESAFKYAGYEEPDLESIWCFGMEQKEQYLKLKSKQPETLNGLYTDSGNFYYRSGWEIDSNYTYLHNGPLGSSHGHSELTHICNYYKGKAFLTDSGRYSYIEGELRNRLKSPEAHNVSVIKGCPMGVPDGSWSYAYFADSLNNYCKTIEGIHYAEMPYVMQNKQKEPAYCCRRILIFPEGIWLLSDDLRMAGTQESTMYFHLAPEVIVKEQKEREVLLENEDVRLILGAEYPLEQRQEILSRIYNENEEHTVFQAKTNWENEGVCTAWMHPENAELKDTVIIQAEGKQVATSVVAKEVWISGELSYVVIMRTHENYRGRKVFLYQNCGFYGKVVILKKTEEGFEVLRFRA